MSIRLPQQPPSLSQITAARWKSPDGNARLEGPLSITAPLQALITAIFTILLFSYTFFSEPSNLIGYASTCGCVVAIWHWHYFRLRPNRRCRKSPNRIGYCDVFLLSVLFRRCTPADH